ncbi:hypothetical protein ES705_21986 [subsurface metagenome]
MEIKNIQLKHTLIYGSIIGVTIALYQVLLYVFGMANNKTLENVTHFLFVLGIFIAVKRFRDQESEGIINFQKAFTTGLLTSMFVAIIGAIYTFFQLKYLSPNLLQVVIDLFQERLFRSDISEDQLEIQFALVEKLFTPALVAWFSVLSYLFIGAIISLIVAVLLKRDENPLLKSD